MLSNLSRRLAIVEQRVADTARREKLSNCNCFPQDPERLGIPFLATNEKEFEAQINLRCPAHGFRRLGKLIVLTIVNPDRTITEESVRLGQVVDEYQLRLSEFLKSDPELEDDSEEF
jgi:hypothetical protein